MKQAIILAGGLGTRLKPTVSHVPKPLAPINGTPFLSILLDRLAMQGIQTVTLAVGYQAQKIMDTLGHLYRNMKLIYSVETEPLGTGGALRLALSQFSTPEPVLVLNGDSYLEFDLNVLWAHWLRRYRPICVACSVEDSARYGRLSIEQGILTGFLEKGLNGQGMINAGVYLLATDQLDSFQVGTPFSFETDYLMPAVSKREFDCIECNGVFIDIGIPKDYQRAQRVLNFTA